MADPNQGRAAVLHGSVARSGDCPSADGPAETVLHHPSRSRASRLVTGRQTFDKLQTWESSRRLLLGDGLIVSTGELWKRQRRLMSTFFTPRSIEQYYPVMLEEAEATAQRWTSFAETGRPIDMLDEMMCVTACIILRSMFGMDISRERLRSLEGDVEDMIRFVNNARRCR